MTDQYYIHYDNGQYCGKGLNCYNSDTYKSIPVTIEFYEAFNPDMWILQGSELIPNPNYEQEEAEKREEQFKKEFFLTSLGWIRRKPTLADGTEDDFLNNDLPLLAIGLMTGSNPVLPIAYQTPDFTQEFTKEYMESLQIKNQPITQQFIAECSAVKMKDFTG